MRALRLVAFVVLLSLPVCAQPGEDIEPEVSATSVAPSPASPSPAPATCPKREGGADTVADLVDVKIERSGAAESIAFRFEASPEFPRATRVPRFEVAAAQPPLAYDGSGDPMQVDGSHYLRIIFHGGSGVRMSGENPERTYRGPKEIKAGQDLIKEAEQAGDFERTLSWVIGLSALRCPTATEEPGALSVTLEFPAA